MKTIEVSDEMYNNLIALATEMTTQDHRHTAMPYIFQIQTKEQIASSEGIGTEAWHYDGSLIETEEEIIDVIFEWKDEIMPKKDIKELTDWEKDEIMELAGWSKVWYDYQERYQNAFFTAKGCQDHIESNSYHYSKPVNYLIHANRNPEMELVTTFLCELVNKKIHK